MATQVSGAQSYVQSYARPQPVGGLKPTDVGPIVWVPLVVGRELPAVATFPREVAAVRPTVQAPSVTPTPPPKRIRVSPALVTTPDVKVIVSSATVTAVDAVSAAAMTAHLPVPVPVPVAEATSPPRKAPIPDLLGDFDDWEARQNRRNPTADIERVNRAIQRANATIRR